MEKNLEEVVKENKELANEYFQYIKLSVKEKRYFEDSLEWYFFRYISPICDRTLLIFGGIISVIVLYLLIVMISGAFPLVVSEPIFINSKDQSIYFSKLVKLKPKKNELNFDPEIKNVDEAVLKYLLSSYISDREGYNFSKAEIEDVNNKFIKIRNNSSSEEYRMFQLSMSKDNPKSPIHDFGKEISKEIDIISVKFIRKKSTTFAEKAMEYVFNNIPTEAEIRFSSITKSSDEYGELKNIKENFVAKVKYEFEGISKDEKSTYIKFLVNKYQLFRVK